MGIRPLALLLGLLALCAPLAVSVGPAAASRSQVALFEDDGGLDTDAQGTMDALRAIGVQEVRSFISWSGMTPSSHSATKPAGFDSASPNAYDWSRYDAIVRAARNDHMRVDFLLGGGAPLWTWGSGAPDSIAGNTMFAWRPSAAEFGNFVHAAVVHFGTVHAWEIYNEPNFGEDIAPQIVNGVYVAAVQYRGIVDAAWKAFSAAHRTHDTILVGQLTARNHGSNTNSNFGQSEPLVFLRDLYCVGTNLKPFTGRSASALSCPTNGRGFAAAHPGLFRSSGIGVHPYPVGLPPSRDSSRDPNYITFNAIPRLETQLNAIARTYHTSRNVGIFNTEYGYVTRPPNRNRQFVSPATAAVYINQAEYLSWRDPRIRTYMQYLLYDPPTDGPSQFFSGLYFADGTPKATFYAYRMPVYLPSQSVRRGQRAEVWGAARPYATMGGHSKISILWRANSHARFKSVATVAPGRGTGYFDTKVKFPGSGQVETSWAAPGLGTISSRIASITVR